MEDFRQGLYIPALSNVTFEYFWPPKNRCHLARIFADAARFHAPRTRFAPSSVSHRPQPDRSSLPLIGVNPQFCQGTHRGLTYTAAVVNLKSRPRDGGSHQITTEPLAKLPSTKFPTATLTHFGAIFLMLPGNFGGFLIRTVDDA
jgi:hypothetical protein